MLTPGTWMSWSFRVGTRAFKEIRPLAISLERVQRRVKTKTFWIFTESQWVDSGEGEVVLTYDRGPFTSTQTESVRFNTYEEAESWYKYIFSTVFINSKDVDPPHKPPKNKKKSSHLSIVGSSDKPS